jgi:hypothetical protein
MQKPFKQVIRRYHKALGRYGGTGTFPSVFLLVFRISCQIKGILQSQKKTGIPLQEIRQRKANP